jgi:predicted PurR-regulated permease PerM
MLIPVALFYLLMDWDRFVAQVREADSTALARSAFDSFHG